MDRLLEQGPEQFARALSASCGRRGWVVSDPESGQPRASAPLLEPLASALAREQCDYRKHEALFFEVGEETGTLFGVFIHKTRRGQAQGGVRYWPYASLGDFVSDGLRLALGMGRKCALAGLWWGGGKAVIAREPGERWRDPGHRRALFADFGRFVASLSGCYVTAEDAGTTPADMAEIYRHTRFATCVPTELGGSGNPSAMTARGVLCAMEAALEFLELGSLDGKRIAMQGAGNVGTHMIEGLLEKGVQEVVASELSHRRQAALIDRFEGTALTVRLVEPGDDAILAEPCDILAPNALGGVLGPGSISRLQARIVCGAANNQLVDDERDALLLAARGITYVPDYVANRMGIVACSNEHAGSLPDDPEIARHLDREASDSIHQVTQRILALARSGEMTSVAAANQLADLRAEELHPIWGHRARAIIDALVRSRWEQGGSD